MSKPDPHSDLPIHFFANASDFEIFLEREHLTLPGFYLKLAKKSCTTPSISGSEAIEVALCFGWIDGRANRLDDNWWTVRYTQRRPKSLWSRKNVQTVARLLDQDRMRPAGVAAVEAAKMDGRWERAYAGPATIEVPKDLEAALGRNTKAKRFFAGMNKSDRYAVLWRVETATPQNRANRIGAMVELLTAGQRPGAPGNSKGTTKASSGVKKAVSRTESAKKSNLVKKELQENRPAQDERTTLPRRDGLRRR
jgi:uncharacterized protein YdeI (YjbR/CyaY-like superfamily)